MLQHFLSIPCIYFLLLFESSAGMADYATNVQKYYIER